MRRIFLGLRRAANYEPRQVYDSENASSKAEAWKSLAAYDSSLQNAWRRTLEIVCVYSKRF